MHPLNEGKQDLSESTKHGRTFSSVRIGLYEGSDKAGGDFSCPNIPFLELENEDQTES